MKPDLSHEIITLAEHQAAFFRVLGNPLRVLILWLLIEKPRTLNEISLAIGAYAPSALHHLRVLEFNRLVNPLKQDELVYYHITEDEKMKSCLVFKNRPEKLIIDSHEI